MSILLTYKILVTQLYGGTAYKYNIVQSLTSINIPEWETSIDQYAFYQCTKLTSVTIATSVTTIGIINIKAIIICFLSSLMFIIIIR